MTHGYLVLAVCVWLVIRARHRIAAEHVRPMPVVCAALLSCAVMWLMFWRASLQDPHLLMLPVLVWLAMLAAFGWRVARHLAFPVAYFVFALPVWWYLNGPLQNLTTRAVGVLAWLTGLPTYIEGNFVTIPAGVFEIAGGCSGSHFLVVGLATAALQGEVARDSLRRRLMLLAIVSGLALLSNWLRVFTIIVAGHLTDMQHALITEGHYWFGWALFAVVIGGFTWLTSRPPAEEAPEREAVATPDRVDVKAYIAAALSLAAVPVIGHAAWSEPDAGALQPMIEMPEGRGGWSGPLPPGPTSWKPIFPGAHGERLALYRSAEGDVVEAYAAVYLVQRQGAELIGEGSSVLGALEQESAHVVEVGGRRYREAVAVGKDGRSLVWWSYDIGGRTFTSPLLAQLWYGVRSLARPVRSSVSALRIQCGVSCEQARAALERFAGRIGADRSAEGSSGEG